MSTNSKKLSIFGFGIVGVGVFIAVFFLINWLFWRLLFAGVGFVAGLIVGMIWMNKRYKKKLAQTNTESEKQ